MIRVWPVLLALAVWLPLAAVETAPAPDAIWINQFDDPGVLVTELIEVPSIEIPTAQPGKARLPRKYSSVLVFRREK